MTNVYRYNGLILKRGGEIAISENCCCDETPPTPTTPTPLPCPELPCDFVWFDAGQQWIALSTNCGDLCECEFFPVDPPNPGDPYAVQAPCVPKGL